MLRLLKTLPIAILLATATGCATSRVTVIDSTSDWVKIGPDVRGRVYVWDKKAKAWSLVKKPIQLPEGWVAGPEPK